MSTHTIFNFANQSDADKAESVLKENGFEIHVVTRIIAGEPEPVQYGWRQSKKPVPSLRHIIRNAVGCEDVEQKLLSMIQEGSNLDKDFFLGQLVEDCVYSEEFDNAMQEIVSEKLNEMAKDLCDRLGVHWYG